jgi:formamidopyrimidine-DNA glycosylase
VRSVVCRFPGVVSSGAGAFCEALRGRAFTAIGRHGKYLFLRLSEGREVALHLRMTGQLLLLPRRQPPDKHCHLEILLAGTDRKLVYRDVRKFGRLELLPGSQEDFIRAHRLGPDALNISPERLYESLRRTRRGLKAALLDQRLLAGLGNIYTDEVLFRERLSPLRSSDSLSRRRVQALAGTIKAVLRAALRRRGTSISDYVDPGGRPGGFQFALLVYGREGAACPRCGAAIVRTRVAGRGTWTCPRCQRVPARRRIGQPRALVLL